MNRIWKIIGASLAIVALCFTVASFSEAGTLAYTNPAFYSAGDPIQVFAPNGTTTTTLTVNSTTVDLTNYVIFEVESGSGTTCNIRLMPTSSKGAYKQTVLRTAGTLYIRAKNTATPFLNMSGCTAGSYTLQ